MQVQVYGSILTKWPQPEALFFSLEPKQIKKIIKLLDAKATYSTAGVCHLLRHLICINFCLLPMQRMIKKLAPKFCLPAMRYLQSEHFSSKNDLENSALVNATKGVVCIEASNSKSTEIQIYLSEEKNSYILHSRQSIIEPKKFTYEPRAEMVVYYLESKSERALYGVNLSPFFSENMKEKEFSLMPRQLFSDKFLIASYILREKKIVTITSLGLLQFWQLREEEPHLLNSFSLCEKETQVKSIKKALLCGSNLILVVKTCKKIVSLCSFHLESRKFTFLFSEEIKKGSEFQSNGNFFFKIFEKKIIAKKVKAKGILKTAWIYRAIQAKYIHINCANEQWLLVMQCEDPKKSADLHLIHALTGKSTFWMKVEDTYYPYKFYLFKNFAIRLESQSIDFFDLISNAREQITVKGIEKGFPGIKEFQSILLTHNRLSILATHVKEEKLCQFVLEWEINSRVPVEELNLSLSLDGPPPVKRTHSNEKGKTDSRD